MSDHLDLLDYRRRVAGIYQAVRSGQGAKAWSEWRRARDELFASHPQSPVDDQAGFQGLDYFEYDERWRTVGILRPTDHEELSVSHNRDDATAFTTLGSVEFNLNRERHVLDVLWLESYGGGLFLPFRDTTNGVSTYGGGRYLLDTVKGADLGHDGDEIVLDFNYSYHPSCVYSDRWSCPLAPPANRLPFDVDAGERLNGEL